MTNAVIETGGKQYKIKEKDILEIEKIPGEKDQEVIFDKVLLLFNKKEEKIEIGKPYLERKKVVGKILEQKKGKKIFVFKYKSKTRHRKKKGYRQLLTKVLIKKIEK